MELKALILADYAVTANGRTTIAGTFDSYDVLAPKGAPDDALKVILLPRSYLVVITEVGLFEGLQHELLLRVTNGSGERIHDDVRFQTPFILNDMGRRMRSVTILELANFVVPGPDDYLIEVYHVAESPVRLGDFILSVVDRTPKVDG